MHGIFYSGLERRKRQTAVSKHLGILLNFRTGGNNARALVKTASFAAIIVCFIRVFVNCDSLNVWYGM